METVSSRLDLSTIKLFEKVLNENPFDVQQSPGATVRWLDNYPNIQN